MPKKSKPKKKPTPEHKRSKKSPTPMPSLVFNDGLAHSSEPLSSNLHQRPTGPRYSNYSKEARRYLWGGVILLSSIIFLLWGLSLKTQIATINWRTVPEANLIKANPTDWNTIFIEREANRSAAMAKESIRLALTQLNAASSSTTSTPETTTSTDSKLHLPNSLPTSSHESIKTLKQ